MILRKRKRIPFSLINRWVLYMCLFSIICWVWDWGLTWGAPLFILDDLLFISGMDKQPISMEGGISEAGPSNRPPMTEPAIDLNRPPAPEPEPAPSSDLLELEAENQRLREANQKLSRAYKELQEINKKGLALIEEQEKLLEKP